MERRSYLLIYSLLVLSVFYSGITKCSSQLGNKYYPNIKLMLKDGVINVSRGDGALSWKGEMITTINWWDAQGKEQSKAVSAVNGWQIEQQQIEKGYSLTIVRLKQC